jgi:UDP-glucose 4-epimerase
VADARVNILGTINLLGHAVRFGVKKFVFTSSVAVFGEPEYLPLDENHPCRPLSPYGASKKAAEDYIRHFQKVHRLPADILILGNVYGPRQDPFGEGGVIAIFTQQMVSGGQPVIYGTGEQTRDFVYVGDVVRALLSCQNLTEDAVRRFVIGTGKATTVESVYQSLKNLVKFDKNPRYLPERAGEIRAVQINSEEAIKTLRWRAEICIEEGLGKTVEWFIETARSK